MKEMENICSVELINVFNRYNIYMVCKPAVVRALMVKMERAGGCTEIHKILVFKGCGAGNSLRPGGG